jgi:hypothetical protein
MIIRSFWRCGRCLQFAGFLNSVIHPFYEKNHFKYSVTVPAGYGARAG